MLDICKYWWRVRRDANEEELTKKIDTMGHHIDVLGLEEAVWWREVLKIARIENGRT